MAYSRRPYYDYYDDYDFYDSDYDDYDDYDYYDFDEYWDSDDYDVYDLDDFERPFQLRANSPGCLTLRDGYLYVPKGTNIQEIIYRKNNGMADNKKPRKRTKAQAEQVT